MHGHDADVDLELITEGLHRSTFGERSAKERDNEDVSCQGAGHAFGSCNLQLSEKVSKEWKTSYNFCARPVAFENRMEQFSIHV